MIAESPGASDAMSHDAIGPGDETPEETSVIIVGTGFGGLGMAHALREAHIDDFVMLERAESIGGTWRDNTYPGCACDVPSHLYSYSFAPSAEWSHVFARQPEIRAYLERCTDAWQLRDRLRFGADVAEVRFDEDTARWHLRTADGRRFIGRFVVFGVGGLKDPQWPKVPGLDRFDGPVMHSARWDADVELSDRRIGVIGTGASAIQIVPELAPVASETTIFQRTPPWIMPRGDRAHGAVTRWLFGNVPGLLRLKRAVLFAFWELRHPFAFGRPGFVSRFLQGLVERHIRKALPDPELAAKALPDYRIGCKRILLSDDWYPALCRDDVHVETTGIDEIVPEGVRLTDGTLVELDALVCCTGFTVDQPLGDMKVIGRGGQALGAFWGDRPRAHLGITVPGFPNAFMLLGPNTALGHTSVLIMIEAQIRYITQAIRHVIDRPDVRAVDVRSDALDAFVARVDAESEGTVWQSGCGSWYLSEKGVNYTLWPGTTVAYRKATRRFEPADYTLE